MPHVVAQTSQTIISKLLTITSSLVVACPWPNIPQTFISKFLSPTIYFKYAGPFRQISVEWDWCIAGSAMIMCPHTLHFAFIKPLTRSIPQVIAWWQESPKSCSLRPTRKSGKSLLRGRPGSHVTWEWNCLHRDRRTYVQLHMNQGSSQAIHDVLVASQKQCPGQKAFRPAGHSQKRKPCRTSHYLHRGQSTYHIITMHLTL